MSRIGLVIFIVLAVFLAGFANLVWGQEQILQNLVPVQTGKCKTPSGVWNCVVGVPAGQDDPEFVFLVLVDEEGIREIVRYRNNVKDAQPEVVWRKGDVEQ